MLFKPYSTLESARKINAAGPGLGLYMCRELCRKMGGEIKLLNKIRKTVGEKAFVLNVAAKVLYPDETLLLESINFEEVSFKS